MNAARLFTKIRPALMLFGAFGLSACDTMVSQDLADNNKTDLLFAVDASTLRETNRAKVEDSIQTIVQGLEASGRDVRYSVYSAGTAGVNPTSQPVGGGAPQSFDIFSNLLGIFGGNQFLAPGFTSGLPIGNPLPSQVTQGFPQLFPILGQITNMTQGGSSQNAIFSNLLPIFSQIFSQQMGGGTSSGLNQQLLMQLIQGATAGQQNGMSQNEIIASLAPQLLAMLQGGGTSSGQNNMASLMLPALLRMFSQSQSGGGQIDQSQIISILAPILLSQINGGNFGGQQPLQLLGFIFPLMQQFTGMDKTQIQNLAVALAPLAVAYFSGGSGAQYAPLVQAMIPLLFQSMGDGSGTLGMGDTAQLLGTPNITSLLSAFAGGGPLADGFLRSGSDFSVVYMGDPMKVGDSTQAANLAHTFLMTLSQLTHRDLSQFSFNSIAMNGTSSCVGKNQGSDVLAALLSQRTSGAVTDLCDVQSIVHQLSH
jgi:hypothetical protein